MIPLVDGGSQDERRVFAILNTKQKLCLLPCFLIYCNSSLLFLLHTHAEEDSSRLLRPPPSPSVALRRSLIGLVGGSCPWRGHDLELELSGQQE